MEDLPEMTDVPGEQDWEVRCEDCGEKWVFTKGEQLFYDSKGLTYPPKRCKPCRDKRKATLKRAGEGKA